MPRDGQISAGGLAKRILAVCVVALALPGSAPIAGGAEPDRAAGVSPPPAAPPASSQPPAAPEAPPPAPGPAPPAPAPGAPPPEPTAAPVPPSDAQPQPQAQSEPQSEPEPGGGASEPADARLGSPLSKLEHGVSWLSSVAGSPMSKELFACSLAGAGESSPRQGGSASRRRNGRARAGGFRAAGQVQCLRVESLGSPERELEVRYGTFHMSTDHFIRANGCDYLSVLGLGRLDLRDGSTAEFGFNYLAWRGAGELHLHDDGDPLDGTAWGEGAIALLPSDGNALAACLGERGDGSLIVRAEIVLSVVH